MGFAHLGFPDSPPLFSPPRDEAFEYARDRIAPPFFFFGCTWTPLFHEMKRTSITVMDFWMYFDFV
jgi:hypothetical protein